MGASDRKSEHLRIAATESVEHRAGTGLERLRLRHRALPGRNVDAVSLETQLLARPLAAPLLISAMTGGTTEAEEVNRRLMPAAAEHGIGLVLGSGRRLLADSALLRRYRPTGAERPPLMLANLGASQVRDADGPATAERLVRLLSADGLSIPVNPLQEAIQPEGDAAFEGVLEGVAAAVRRIAPLPVVIKEVGFGLAGADVAALRKDGVAAVDVAGAGGNNWALVGGRREDRAGVVAAAFADWGLGAVDCAKCLALGAAACGIARPLLLAARANGAVEAVGDVVRQLRIATWLAGAASASEPGREHLR